MLIDWEVFVKRFSRAPIKDINLIEKPENHSENGSYAVPKISGLSVDQFFDMSPEERLTRHILDNLQWFLMLAIKPYKQLCQKTSIKIHQQRLSILCQVLIFHAP